MRSGTIALVLALLAALHLPGELDPLWLEALPAAAAAAMFLPRARLLACMLVGALWGEFHLTSTLGQRLSAEWEGEDVVVEGRVVGIPVRDSLRTRFDFEVQRSLTTGLDLEARIALSSYSGSVRPRPGERWRLTVRLKQPRGLMNPGGYDYERRLLIRRIAAVGYVRAGPVEPRRLGQASRSVDRWRERWIARLDAALADHPARPLALALGLGHRAELSDRTWRVLQMTGTGHLMAISGLHVGMVAGIVFWLTARLWGLSAGSLRLVESVRVGALAAMAAAAAYAIASGFSVPTQRALIMVFVVMAGVLTRRHVVPSRSLAVAALGVVAVDPFSVLAAGFWLSFGAVAVILHALAPARHGAAAGLWARWCKAHLTLAFALAPLSLFFFDIQSVSAPLANLVAVPSVAMLGLPILLAGMLLTAVAADLGAPVVQLAAWVVHGVWLGLEWLSTTNLHLQTPVRVPLWVACVASLGVASLLLPRGVPGRWLGWVLVATLFARGEEPLPPGTLELAVLDVGQGLAVVARSGREVMVYDTGPRYRTGFDTGALVLVPYLRSLGVSRVDVLVVSHGDLDHAGGARSLLEHFPVERVVSNVLTTGERCVAGSHWGLGDGEVRVLAPEDSDGEDSNDRSCVLRIGHRAASVLLPGDIERYGEQQLLGRYSPEELAAKLLIAPHHGSRTSSSEAFLEQVAPQAVVFAVGYRNRFGFPAEEVVARYRHHGAAIYRTDRDGAVIFEFHTDGTGFSVRRYRAERRSRWIGKTG